MERAGTFRLESQMDSVFAYGDLVNKLGRYEDQDEENIKIAPAQKAGARSRMAYLSSQD